MGLFDRLFGTDDSNQQHQQQPQRSTRSDDEIAVERYRYLLRTAPPETIEQVHAEAFSKLTQEQRDLLFAQLSENASEAPRDTSPAALASSATRQELRNPGTMERSFNGGGMGFGSTVASSLLGTVAGYVIGSALVSAFVPNDFGSDSGADNADNTDSGADSADSADAGDTGGDSGGDFGGGDFGGGDFGGGDFGGGFDF